MSITAQQAQDLANFWRTIGPANTAERAVVDKLNADESAWLNETSDLLDDIAAASVTVASTPHGGTVTTYTLFSEGALRSTGRAVQ